MDILVKLFYMIFLCSIGAGTIYYRKTVKSWTGEFQWAEKYLGRGGTYTVIIFFGIFMIFWGMMIPFGGLDKIFGVESDSIVGPVTGDNQNTNITN